MPPSSPRHCIFQHNNHNPTTTHKKNRRQAAVDATVAALRAEGLTAAGAACHVGDPQQRATLLEACARAFGPRLDVLVSNAAVNPIAGPILDAPLEAVAKIFDVNVTAALALAQLAAPRMARGGSVVVVSSVTAFRCVGGVVWGVLCGGCCVGWGVVVGPRSEGSGRHAASRQPAFLPQSPSLSKPPWHPPTPPPATHKPVLITLINATSPSPPLGAYAVSKTALLGLVKALAEELGPRGVRVTGVVSLRRQWRRREGERDRRGRGEGRRRQGAGGLRARSGGQCGERREEAAHCKRP